jgi:hypothetical protein
MMKRNQYIFATMMALALVATGCSNEDNLTNGSEPQVITINAGVDANADSRVTYTDGTTTGGTQGLIVNWESTDAFTAYASASNAGTFSTPTVATDAHYATFTGSFATALTEATSVYAYVTKSAVTVNGTNVTTDLSSQDGTATGAENHDILFAKGTYDPNATTPMTLGFAHQVSFLKLMLTFPTSETGTTATNITLKGTGLYKDVTLKSSDASLSSGTAGDITIPSAAISSNVATVYACVYPGALSNVTVSATVGSTIYKFTIGTKTLAAGKIYRVSCNNPTADTESLAVATAFESGDGSSSNPYKIATLAQLRYMASLFNAGNTDYQNKHWELTADINLGDGTAEWIPIGNIPTTGYSYRGWFDGKGHTISGVMKILTMSTTADSGYGLFGICNNGTIQNIKNTATVIAPVQPTVGAYLGSIVGRALYHSTILNCSNSGDVSGACLSVGGIAGGGVTAKTSLVFQACSNSGNVHNAYTGSGSKSVGGIMGNMNVRSDASAETNIVGCCNTCSLVEFTGTGTNYVGGIIGYNNSNIANYCKETACWSSATTLVGGPNKGILVGDSKNSILTNCYAKEITGIDFVGKNENTSTTLTNCESFTGTTPTSTQIDAMNTAWQTANSARAYQFDANGAIVAK